MIERHRRSRSLALVVAVGTIICGCTSAGTKTPDGSDSVALTVLAAASLTEAFTELGGIYESEHPGATVTFAFEGSTSLVRQALDGAEADVLATASPATMLEAVNGGATAEAPDIFARNSLTLIVPEGNPAGITALADLADQDLIVVLCAVEVPCGAAAEAAFAAAGVEPAPDSREQDVKGVLAKVSSGEADAGLVYVTDARAAESAVDSVELPKPQRVVTDYPIVTLAASADPISAHEFINLVTSDEGHTVLESYGFQVP